MISSCSKEEFYEDEISVIPQTAIEAKSKKILIDDIDNPILKQVLNGIKTGQLNRGYSDSTIIEIEDQFATYIESKDGNYHSYTFYVTNTPKDEGLENVLFSLNRSGGYDVFLVRYDVTEADIDALAHGETNTSDWKPNYYLLDQDLNVVDPIAFISKENACVHAVNYLCKFGNHPGGMLNGEPC